MGIPLLDFQAFSTAVISSRRVPVCGVWLSHRPLQGNDTVSVSPDEQQTVGPPFLVVLPLAFVILPSPSRRVALDTESTRNGIRR